MNKMENPAWQGGASEISHDRIVSEDNGSTFSVQYPITEHGSAGLDDPEVMIIGSSEETALDDVADPTTEWATGKEGSLEAVTFDDFLAYMPMHTYIYIPTGQTWPTSSVNSRISPVEIITP